MADKKLDDFFTRPPTLSRGQQFSKFLYNPSTHEVLGRSAKSWAQITVFYIVLYAFLAGFFAALLTVFFQTLDENTPRWTMQSSLLGTNPGMGYRPLHPNPDYSVISFTNNSDSIAMWRDATDAFLQPYYEKGDHVSCDYGTERETSDKACRFPVEMNKCATKNSYGFADGKPCIFLKLNKIFGWTPVPFTKEQIDNNATGMPEKLLNTIKGLDVLKINNNVWVSCADAESKSEVTVEYDGHPGFPAYYFPYTNQKNYQNPFVVMQVHNLPVGTVTRINCQLWAQNIVVDRQRRLGMASLEILAN